MLPTAFLHATLAAVAVIPLLLCPLALGKGVPPPKYWQGQPGRPAEHADRCGHCMAVAFGSWWPGEWDLWSDKAGKVLETLWYTNDWERGKAWEYTNDKGGSPRYTRISAGAWNSECSRQLGFRCYEWDLNHPRFRAIYDERREFEWDPMLGDNDDSGGGAANRSPSPPPPPPPTPRPLQSAMLPSRRPGLAHRLWAVVGRAGEQEGSDMTLGAVRDRGKEQQWSLRPSLAALRQTLSSYVRGGQTRDADGRVGYSAGMPWLSTGIRGGRANVGLGSFRAPRL